MAANDINTLEEFENLTETIRKLSDPDEIAKALFDVIRHFLPVHAIGLYLFKNEYTGLVPLGEESLGVLDLALTLKEEGVVDWVLQINEPVFAPSLIRFDRDTQFDNSEAFVVPLMVDEKPLGTVFAVLNKPSSEISDITKKLVHIAAKQASVSISKAFTYVEAEKTMAYLSSLLATVNDIIYATDEAGLISFVNNRVEVFGRTPQSLIGRPIYELIPYEREKGRTIQVLQEGEEFTYDIELEVKDKETLWFQVNQMPFRDSNDQVTGSLGTLRDISKRVELEQKVRDTERFAALSEAAIGINHEINNPLSVIQGNLYLLELALPLDQYPKARQQIEILRQHSNRIAKVVKKLDQIEQLQSVDYAGDLRMIKLNVDDNEDTDSTKQ